MACALVGRMGQWVNFERDASATKRAFMAKSNFPNVIGCIDCTDVRIIGKSHNNAFFNQLFSILLVVVRGLIAVIDIQL